MLTVRVTCTAVGATRARPRQMAPNFSHDLYAVSGFLSSLPAFDIEQYDEFVNTCCVCSTIFITLAMMVRMKQRHPRLAHLCLRLPHNLTHFFSPLCFLPALCDHRLVGA